jgi:hypothetical protein
MDKKNPFVTGALVALLGTAVGAGSAFSALLINDHVRTSTRYDQMQDSNYRDPEMSLRIQNRRNSRIQSDMADAAMEAETLHGAAPLDETPTEFDRRAYFRADKWCKGEGYTRSRLIQCRDTVIRSGVYEYDS